MRSNKPGARFDRHRQPAAGQRTERRLSTRSGHRSSSAPGHVYCEFVQSCRPLRLRSSRCRESATGAGVPTEVGRRGEEGHRL